jgi:hypothetical protein
MRSAAVALVFTFLGISLLFAQNAGNQPQSKPPVKRVRADLSGFDLDPPKSGGTQVGGGSRGGQTSSIVLDAPRKGLAYSLHPWFQWHDPDASRDFVFRLFDANGDELFETNLDRTSLQYPADAPELKPGASYSWTVQHAGQSSLEPPLPAQINILSEGERKQFTASVSDQAADLQAARRRAEAFVAKRLWYDSIEAYSKLIAQYPQSAELYRRRGEIYSQLPATRDLAEHDFQQAEKLK